MLVFIDVTTSDTGPSDTSPSDTGPSDTCPSDTSPTCLLGSVWDKVSFYVDDTVLYVSVNHRPVFKFR